MRLTPKRPNSQRQLRPTRRPLARSRLRSRVQHQRNRNRKRTQMNAFILCVGLLFCQREVTTQKSVTVQGSQSGRSVTKQSSELRRLDKPVLRPSMARPEVRVGRDRGNWYWHPRYAQWFWLGAAAQV